MKFAINVQIDGVPGMWRQRRKGHRLNSRFNGLAKQCADFAGLNVQASVKVEHRPPYSVAYKLL